MIDVDIVEMWFSGLKLFNEVNCGLVVNFLADYSDRFREYQIRKIKNVRYVRILFLYPFCFGVIWIVGFIERDQNVGVEEYFLDWHYC